VLTLILVPPFTDFSNELAICTCTLRVGGGRVSWMRLVLGSGGSEEEQPL
jgi:hypothetical protein